MINLVLITSVINVPNKPLSYTNIRSVFTRKERFEQTKKTILSIKEKIPNCKILIVECTDFIEKEKVFFNNNCDFILNLWEQKNLHSKLFGLSKSLGEGTQTIKALEFIKKNNIMFNNFFKISGRYWLDNFFDYKKFDNNKYIFKRIFNKNNNIFTALYKIPEIDNLLFFLKDNVKKMENKIGYEILFGYFQKKINKNNLLYLNNIGLDGYVTFTGELCSEYYNRLKKNLK